MKYLLYIGPYPLNVGGISVHIRRLAGLMKNDYHIDYIDEGRNRYDGVFNIRDGNIIKYFLKVKKADIIHIHSGVWLLRALNIFVCKILFRKKVLVTIHRDPNIEPHSKITRFLLSKCDYAILVNQEGYNAMFCSGDRCIYVLLPAFLPPQMDDEPYLSEEITKWIESARNRGAFIMCSNAWNLVLHNGEDLYGLDMCIEAIRKLGLNYYLIFVVATNSDQQELMSYYKKQINSWGLTNNILILEEPSSFVRILQKSDLVIRATNTDGDAISVREALYYGKPVLASDVVKRPDGVYVFTTRDVEDMVTKIKMIEADKGATPYSCKDFYTLYKTMYG